MKQVRNVMKKGKLTISKIEGYKTKWSAEFLVLGTKKKEIYYNEQVVTHPTYGLRFKVGDNSLGLDRWSKQVRPSNFIKKEGECEHIVIELIKDNVDWLVKSLCNSSKTTEYEKVYGGYSKGCYEFKLAIE